jgi:hypothetical protein
MRLLVLCADGDLRGGDAEGHHGERVAPEQHAHRARLPGACGAVMLNCCAAIVACSPFVVSCSGIGVTRDRKRVLSCCVQCVHARIVRNAC